MSDQSVRIFALLIGIDDYKAVPKLRGCVRDVIELRTLLINRFKVPETQIKLLTDAQASREGIMNAFKTHLIDNSAIKKGDQIVFHYSGHGSQMNSQSANEPDGLDETLVAWDSRTRAANNKYVYDIPDKTLAGLIDQLAAAKGENITIILDCCHSGSGTREIKLNTRRAPIDLTPLPTDAQGQPIALDAEIVASLGKRGLSGATPSGWDEVLSNHVLLAGCRDAEESNEYRAAPNHVQGAMSYFLLQALSNLQPNSTYSDVHAQVAAQVNMRYRDQMPQCEGQRNRAVFGGATLQRDPFILVQSVNDAQDEVELSAGLLHGLREKTVLALYPEAVKTLADVPTQASARVEVVSSSAISARAKVIDKNTDIKALMRAIITEQQFDKRAVSVSGDDETGLMELRKHIEASPYLTLSESPTDLHVVLTKGAYTIQDGDKKALTEPLKDVAEAVTALTNVARYQRLLTLRNEDVESEIAGKLKLRLRKLQKGKPPSEMEIVASKEGGDIVLDYSPALEKAGECDFIVEIINDSPIRIYPQLFYMDGEYAILTFYPRSGQQEAIEPGKSLFCMKGAGGRNLGITLPESWDWSNEYLKLIGTLTPTDLSTLDQKGLKVPAQTSRDASRSALQMLFDEATQGSRQVRNDVNNADWGTAELPVRIVRKSTKRDLPIDAQDVPVLDNVLTLKKPAGMTGEMTVTPIEASKRGDINGVRPPPGLEAAPDVFQPLGGQGNTRDVGASGVAIDLNIDAVSRAAISESNPLIFERSSSRGDLNADSGVYVVAFDGEDYMLVGQSSLANSNEIAITQVPEPVATSRSVGSTIRFFFYKKMGRFTDELGLRYAVPNGEEAIYSAIDKTVFKPGQTVALMVHGFSSETNWMVTKLLPYLRREVLPYDHCITFDYESFGTGVAANGHELALALQQQCGFTPEDQITVHLYAHSMGCLVSRCAIELPDGATFIDKVVLAGPPNNGTTLATTGKGLAYIVSQALGHFVPGPVGTVLRKGLNQLSKQGAGIADLVVKSAITQQINELAKPDNVPYLSLAGLNSPDPTQQARMQRLAHKMLDVSLDTLFGEQNDGVIGRSSMRSVRNGSYPHLTITEAPCDHFGYYADSVAQQAIQKFIKS